MPSTINYAKILRLTRFADPVLPTLTRFADPRTTPGRKVEFRYVQIQSWLPNSPH